MTKPALSPLDQLKALVQRGTGTDLTPTTRDQVDQKWMYEYIEHLDSLWRERLTKLIGELEAIDPPHLIAEVLRRQQSDGLCKLGIPCGLCDCQPGIADAYAKAHAKELWSALQLYLDDDAQKLRAQIKAYADERELYGYRGRTVHSSRIASDLVKILHDNQR